MSRLMMCIFAATVALSLWYNVSVFKRGLPAVRRQTTLELRALLKERVRVRKLGFKKGFK